NFPSHNPVKKKAPLSLLLGLKLKPEEVYYSDGYYLVVYKSEKDVFSIAPDFNELMKLKSSEVIVTAPGTRSDFVSRMFAPGVGINEDPVTGSAHTILTPYWSKRLNKQELKAFQVSKRGGKLLCRDLGDRTEISGEAALYLKGEIYI
ncbi:MAG: PhzF family phenazine biosynthesis protein, partial [Melioribacteraceae bacterium]|nr:PhzF family phenazine biosynthesis protein [Melioribacteraceae bacterium]